MMKLATSIFALLVALLVTCQACYSNPLGRSNDGQCKSCLKTAKERLGLKGDDEQRVNDCKVPIMKRGLKLRSAKCDHKRVRKHRLRKM